MKNTTIILFTVLLTSIPFRAWAMQVEAYDLPSCYQESVVFSIDVSGTSVPVSKMFSVYEYAHYSFEGNTTVSITVPGNITQYSISPLAYGIEGSVNGKTLSFSLEQSRYLIVKINNYPDLIIAADDLETNIPSSSGEGIFNIVTGYAADPTGTNMSTSAIQNAINAANGRSGGGIVYIPKGVYYSSNLLLRSNVSIYMEAGAVIRGTGNAEDYRKDYNKNSQGQGSWFIRTASNSSNMKIFGRGIIDGNGSKMRNSSNRLLMTLLMPLQCSNMTVDGIIFRDSGLWGVTLTRSDNLTFLNTKHFNENDLDHENDAVDVQECQNVLFKHSIAISEDDTYSTKTWESSTDIATSWPGTPEILDNVVFDDCVAWSRCATYKVGFGVCQSQSNIVFKNSVSYRSMRAITVNHKYCPAPATNITFDNIDIEGFWPRVGSNSICRWLELDMAYEGGTVNGVCVKNIRVRNVGLVGSVIKGFSATSPLQNITLKNIYMANNETRAQTLQEMNITQTNNHIVNLRINPEDDTAIVLSSSDFGETIYPNPTTGRIYIKEKADECPVSIFDFTGRLLLKTKSSEPDMSPFSNGIYFVKIQDKTMKLIKKS
jgi:polygalacturonase